MIDVKKLITGFLILASVAGSLAFVFSGSTLNPNPPASLRGAKTGAEPRARIPANAFVQAKGPANAGLALSEPLQNIPPADSANLTENVAQNLARELLELNPSGPQNVGGEPSLIAPSSDKIATAVNSSLKSFVAQGNYAEPNFDEKISGGEIKTLADFDEKSVTSYLETINGILQKTIASPETENLAKAGPSAEAVTAMQTIYDSAIHGIKSTPAPVPLASIHKQLLALLVNRKKFVDIAAGAETDPLKTLFLVSGTGDKIDEVLERDYQNFGNEIKKIDFKKLSRKNGGEFLALLEKIFWIEKAEAFIFVPIDCLGPMCQLIHAQTAFTSAHTLGNWLRMIWQWLRLYLTEQLKQMLINLIQRNILSWIQGQGVPLFVTSWINVLTNSFNAGGGTALHNIALPQTCTAFQGIITNILSPKYDNFVPRPINPTPSHNCSLQNLVGDIQGFYNNFSNFTSGNGWLAYGASVLPANNLYGSLFAAAQIADRAAERSQRAAEDKAVAGQGHTGTAVCDDGTPEAYLRDSDVCFDGTEPRVTTPGATVSDISSHGTRAQIDRIVNANDLWGLLTGLTTSLLTGLINSGLNGISGIIPSSIGHSGDSTAPPPANGTTPNASCSGITDPVALAACLNGSGSSASSTLTCNPSNQEGLVGVPVGFGAYGGDGVNYAWSAPGGSPASGAQPSFETTYFSVPAGSTRAVTVTGGGQSANCYVLF